MKSVRTWSSHVKLTQEAVEECNLWINRLEEVEGQPIRPQPLILTTECDHTVAGDASNTGLYLAQTSGTRKSLLSRPFNVWEIRESSPFSELQVLDKFYTSKEAARYEGKMLLHLTDNWVVT